MRQTLALLTLNDKFPISMLTFHSFIPCCLYHAKQLRQSTGFYSPGSGSPLISGLTAFSAIQPNVACDSLRAENIYVGQPHDNCKPLPCAIFVVFTLSVTKAALLTLVRVLHHHFLYLCVKFLGVLNIHILNPIFS